MHTKLVMNWSALLLRQRQGGKEAESAREREAMRQRQRVIDRDRDGKYVFPGSGLTDNAFYRERTQYLKVEESENLF